MICLKNRTFAVSQTTVGKLRCYQQSLWFAWKIVLLQYRKQQYIHTSSAERSCDLLEKSYFCSIANNRSLIFHLQEYVVICLKNRTFAVSQTTYRLEEVDNSQLWFAWKIVLLQYRKQPVLYQYLMIYRCDLLEKSYFCSIANNTIDPQIRRLLVVICLKNRTFAVSQTTSIGETRQGVVLWFAWKIVLLQYRKQRFFKLFALVLVVICLKNRTFAVSQTTEVCIGSYIRWLWFAWKIVLLQYRKQHFTNGEEQHWSCDLLEKSYFCSIANNRAKETLQGGRVVICLKNRTFAVSQTTASSIRLYSFCCDLLEKSYFCSIANNSTANWAGLVTVVICLKNRTFAVSQTTPPMTAAPAPMLWFAWKIVLLQYRKQRIPKSSNSGISCDLLEKSYFCSIANNFEDSKGSEK